MSETDGIDLEAFDNDEGGELDPDKAEVLVTTRGPDDRISSRVPKQIKRALELAEEMSDGTVKKSDLIRKALFDFLSENNREALIKAKQEIEEQMERTGT